MRKIGWLACAVVMTVAFVGGGGSASAQVISLAVPGGGPNGFKNAGNSADDFSDGLVTGRQRQTTIVVVSNTTSFFRVRYQEIVAADTGTFGSDTTQTQASDYTLPFSVTAPGSYRLNISTSINGAFTRVSDGGGEASVDMSAVTGTFTGGSLSSGTLSLTDPGSIPNGGATLDTPFARTSAAVITGTSNGVSQAHTLRFTWTGTCTTNATGFLNGNGGDECALRMGLPSTLSNQTAGAYGAGSPGNRPQAPDGHFVTVTLENLCGNGVIDAPFEQCDQGANNGLSSFCCTSSCQFRAAGQTCRPLTGICDLAETCTGGSPICPPNVFVPAGSLCRASAGVCDPLENCTGVGPNCPPDGLSPSFVVCRAVAGVCDVAENCTGSNVDCPADAKKASGTVCRGSAGICDIVETCDGSTDDCPADAVEAPTTVCRSAAGDCDVAEFCDGSSTLCPANALQPSTHECRAVNGICDQAENCTGTTVNCPPDAFLGSMGGSFVCRAAAGVCDAVEECPGTGPNCPADAKVPSGTVCRANAGICDVVENCNGIGDNCPSDAFQPSTQVCRPATDDCDAIENCTGSGAFCPTDLPIPDSDGDSFCDAIDVCPATPDPSQADGDADGEGDACDACTNILPSFADRPKVTVTKLLTPVGDDRLKIQGRCIPFQEDPGIDPIANGVRVLLQTNTNAVVLDVTIPGGAYDPVNKVGWKVHSFPTGITALYKNAGTIVPYIQGIKTVKFVAKAGVGLAKFKVLGKDGGYPVPPGGAPVKATWVAAPPVSMNGQCCEMYFPGLPGPSCSFVSGGNTLRCK